MSENRAADYIAFGLNRGVDRFLEGVEKRRDEEKRAAKAHRGLAAFMEATGWLTKDQADMMDADSLQGFAEGKMASLAQQRQSEASAMREMEALRKFQSDQSIAGYGQALGNNVAMGFSPALSNFYENPEQFQERPAFDYQGSVANAMDRFSDAAADERFGAVNSTFQHLQPQPPHPVTPSDLQKNIEMLRQFGVPEGDLKKIATDVTARAHPSGQERFDLNYSDQLMMKAELDALTAEAQLGIFKSKPQEYEKRLKNIEDKYKSRARKSVVDNATPPAAAKKPDVTPTARVRVKSPTGQIGFIPSDQLEEAKKSGYTVVE